MRGSITAYSRSMTRLATQTTATTIAVTDCTTNRSLDRIDVSKSDPIPFMLKYCSTTSAPPTIPPSCTPTLVSSEKRELRSACVHNTRPGGTPLALASVTKSLCNVWIMSPRNSLAKIAASGSVSTTTGKKKLRKWAPRSSHGITFSPVRGNHPSLTTNRKMMNGARTRAGNDTNKNDRKLPPRSNRESRLYA